MPTIYTIGETVLDVIFKDNQPVASKPGGSMLNTSVSLGRLGLPVSFVSEIGIDKVGELVVQFLSDNHVDTKHLYRYSDGKTALALAFLDKENNAGYDFYKQYPLERLKTEISAILPDDYLLFGSFYGITNEIRPALEQLLKLSANSNAFVYYDPNFRKAHLHELSALKPLIIQNMTMASMVRCSNEDMELIAGAHNPDDAYQFVSQYCNTLVYTNSMDGVYVYTPAMRAKFPVKTIVPVSTIGAGDTFNAGIIYGLHTRKIIPGELNDLSEGTWEEIIETAVNFATDVCLSYDNYISTELATKYANKNEN